MNPTVVWTFRGQQQLHFLLAQLCNARNPQPNPGQATVQAELSDRLAVVFPTATAVIVLDLYRGFRPRPAEYILLADVRYAAEGAGGTTVVKLADDDRLRAEMDAWVHTKEPQFNGDGVFMRQSVAYHPQYRHRIVGLMYQDAETHIEMKRQVFLEEAFIGAVRHDSPTVESVLSCFQTLFRRLSAQLYAGRHRQRLPWTENLELNPDRGGGRSLNAPLDKWASEPQRRRSILAEWREPSHRAALQAVERGVAFETPFRNPIDFFDRFAAELDSETPDPMFLVPLTRGPAHGDLHGRNVIVGLEDDRADQPAVYDYEHMSRGNLILLDFAKLETELKLRAYPYLYRLERQADDVPSEWVVRRMHRMEAQLAAGSDAFSPAGTDRPASEPETRLFRLLAGLRRHAEETRPPGEISRTQWVREYLLMLAAYGTYTVRFREPPDNERLYEVIALISAGVAAGQWIA